MRRLSILALAGALLATPAMATGEIESLITQSDRDRLAAFDETRERAREEAKAGAPADIVVLDAAFDAPSLPLDGFDLSGNWQCRTIKVGGLADLVVYGWFRCRVDDDGSGWRLEKLTGSQRTAGRFFTESADRMTYLGAFYVQGDPQPRYGAGPETDQVAYARRTGESRWQLEFPRPVRESTFDVLQLRR